LRNRSLIRFVYGGLKHIRSGERDSDQDIWLLPEFIPALDNLRGAAETEFLQLATSNNPNIGQRGIDTTATFLLGGRLGWRYGELKMGLSATYDKDKAQFSRVNLSDELQILPENAFTRVEEGFSFFGLAVSVFF